MARWRRERGNREPGGAPGAARADRLRRAAQLLGGRLDPPGPLLAAVRRRHPPLAVALAADARVAGARRGLPPTSPARLPRLARLVRLGATDGAFGGLALYRVQAAAQRRGTPVVGALAHRLAVSWGQVSIGERTIVHPGVSLPHGQVVIAGLTEVHPGTVIGPFVTIGLKAGVAQGPTIGPDVTIEAGAKLFGPIVVGAGARVAANAVVLHDVAPGASVGGIPATPDDAAAPAPPTIG